MELCLLILGSTDTDQDDEQQSQADGQNDHPVLDQASQDKANEGYTGSQEGVGQLSLDVVDVVTLCTGGCHDSGIGNRRAVVATDSASQAGGNSNDHQLAAGEYGTDDGQQSA